jgi:hypothetical protein
MVWFLLLILAAVALGIAGVVIKGLLYLLVIGVVLFLCAFIVLVNKRSADSHGRATDPAVLSAHGL